MKIFMAILLFCLSSAPVSAATIEDVVLIETLEKKGEVVLKLRVRSAPDDSYFFVVLDPQDPQLEEKTALVNKKTDDKDDFQLDLMIPSFSPHPSGSKYRSKYVKFRGKEK
jgi:hypothetical protein